MCETQRQRWAFVWSSTRTRNSNIGIVTVGVRPSVSEVAAAPLCLALLLRFLPDVVLKTESVVIRRAATARAYCYRSADKSLAQFIARPLEISEFQEAAAGWTVGPPGARPQAQAQAAGRAHA